MSADVPPSALARCATHPDELAGATCQRCGGFMCGTCATRVMYELGLYCPACAARPEMNYLETFRQKLWGKRDSGAWLVAFFVPFAIAGGVKALRVGAVPAAVSLLASAGVGVGFFLGQRWARYALLLVPFALVFLALPALGVPQGFAQVAALIFPLLGALQLFLDPRNQLFFRLDISQRALHRLWDLKENNPLARHAVTLGVGAFMLPLFAPIAIVCGCIALRRVDPQARPPIGRRGSAVSGIVLGVLALVFWAYALMYLFGFVSHLP
ncbi:DUF4190 domain-containing protein [Pyxidicoccus fallax]|uniref:DUF4190 domain-containing protein n=1 Tax=Pyxidicoccus fallax TaxID=394095 RepID=A0A848LQY5_9BACT|nr:DUF4190 domain-containing protein [Pyxidicoccus fallax]NMO20318.1 DUF4190 domain-containing protein [Pyxidicoccus fallax]NPC81074.1 DUF4190 domain-containing protein [Pyxidicoccus fallax]